LVIGSLGHWFIGSLGHWFIGKMIEKYKILLLLVLVWLFTGCYGNHTQNTLNRKQSESLTASVKKQKAIDSQMALGDRLG